MNKKEAQEFIKEMRKNMKKILKSKKSARKFLIKLGTNKKNGKLTKNYK